MAQIMMRNNPRFANNSILQQSLDTLRSNPEVVNQLSQAMSDPNPSQRPEQDGDHDAAAAKVTRRIREPVRQQPGGDASAD